MYSTLKQTTSLLEPVVYLKQNLKKDVQISVAYNTEVTVSYNGNQNISRKTIVRHHVGTHVHFIGIV